jgi:hypothetical protein
MNLLKPLAVCAALISPVLVAAQRPAGVTFADITAAAGIRFVHNNGATGKKFLPETMGSGVVVFDADADGWQDVLFINGTKYDGEAGEATTAALYRNAHNGTFANITQGSGLDIPLNGMGGSAGDFDNDGRTDVFITAVNGGHLFRNAGNGKFADVTAAAGVADPEWSSSAMWLDYNADGLLDLMVARYVEWTVAFHRTCTPNGRDQTYCTPMMYKGGGPQLFRNRGNGTFENVTKAAGVFEDNDKMLGLAALDYDGDGDVDVFVANDTVPNKLYRNNADGTFTNVSFLAGVGVTRSGNARAGMGVDAADYNDSGRPSVAVGNFSNEMMALFRNDGGGLFVDEAPNGVIGRESRLSLTFGLFFFDYDLDGRLDLFATNGHISEIFPTRRDGVRLTYAQRPHLFHNLGKGLFEEAITAVGPDLAREVVGRGTAYADIDNDGDLDIFVTESHGPARLYRNDGANANHAVRFKLGGVKSNRDAIGARIEIVRTDGSKAWSLVKSGSSYLSQSELPVTFGLGAATQFRSATVTWPGGRTESIPGGAADREIVVREGAGIASATALRRVGR